MKQVKGKRREERPKVIPVMMFPETETHRVGHGAPRRPLMVHSVVTGTPFYCASSTSRDSRLRGKGPCGPDQALTSLCCSLPPTHQVIFFPSDKIPSEDFSWSSCPRGTFSPLPSQQPGEAQRGPQGLTSATLSRRGSSQCSLHSQWLSRNVRTLAWAASAPRTRERIRPAEGISKAGQGI